MIRSRVNLDLYLVISPSLISNASVKNIIEKSVQGGVSVVQLREKNCSTKEFYSKAKLIKKLTDSLNVPLIINDRIDIAIAIDAAGVHIGQNDMPCNIARKILGSNKVIGLSIEKIDQATEANSFDIDYLGISPVFYTSTKNDISKPLGLKGVEAIKKISKFPIVGIGGIKTSNVADVIKAGVNGVAVVTAITESINPLESAREFISIIKSTKQNL